MADETLPLPLDLRPQRIATKRCSKCGERKPITEFYSRSDRPGKLKPECKPCYTISTMHSRSLHPETHAAYYRDNPEKFRGWRQTTYQNGRKDFRRCISGMLNVRARQCREKGIKFEISTEDVTKLFDDQNGICALTGRPLVWGAKGRPRDALSVDRLEGSLGYVVGNIRLVTDQANLARNRFSDEELFAFCEAVLATRAASC